ncbi:MAG: isocitrate/isopropylmalate family dehydrogenase [Hyphomicrobiaceae bacterium]
MLKADQLVDLLVEVSTAHLVRNPEPFDAICATNFFGDILSDLASELSGSLGLVGLINASATHCCGLAQHGSTPDIAGKNFANPTSMILIGGEGREEIEVLRQDV